MIFVLENLLEEYIETCSTPEIAAEQVKTFFENNSGLANVDEDIDAVIHDLMTSNKNNVKIEGSDNDWIRVYFAPFKQHEEEITDLMSDIAEIAKELGYVDAELCSNDTEEFIIDTKNNTTLAVGIDNTDIICLTDKQTYELKVHVSENNMEDIARAMIALNSVFKKRET